MGNTARITGTWRQSGALPPQIEQNRGADAMAVQFAPDSWVRVFRPWTVIVLSDDEFLDWPIVGKRNFVGVENESTLRMNDPLFWESLWITVKFAALFVPLNIVLAVLLRVSFERAVACAS